MDSKEAISILAERGDVVARKLGVEEVPGWRDMTGTAHLYVRGALMPLERIV